MSGHQTLLRKASSSILLSFLNCGILSKYPFQGVVTTLKNEKWPYIGDLILFISMLRILSSADERLRRLSGSGLALYLGMGANVMVVAEAIGISKSTIYNGVYEVIGIYDDILKGDGWKHWEAASVQRPNNPFDIIYAEPLQETVSLKAISGTDTEISQTEGCPESIHGNDTGTALHEERPESTRGNDTETALHEELPESTRDNDTGTTLHEECPESTHDNDTGTALHEELPESTRGNDTGTALHEELPESTRDNDTGTTLHEECPKSTHDNDTGTFSTGKNLEATEFLEVFNGVSDSSLVGICRKPKRRGRKNQGKTKRKKKPRVRRNLKGTVGRPPVYVTYPEIIRLFLSIIYYYVYGDPMTTRLWVSCSHHHIHDMLAKVNVCISDPTIGNLLYLFGYSRQKNKKMLPVVNQHPDRDKQFIFIKAMREHAVRSENWILLSSDAKKEEKIGNYANNGTEYRPIENPRLVNDHDFKDNDKGIIKPYVIYDVKKNKGYSVLGRTYDTPEFAIACYDKYFSQYAQKEHPGADHVLILCDGGGSNSSRARMWKNGLQVLADKYNLTIHVCHYPPGTSKWNPVEHRVLSEISKGWAGRPLLTIDHAVNYIKNSGTTTGLTIECEVDETSYEKGKTLSKKEMNALLLHHVNRRIICPQWNYIVYGKEKPKYIESSLLDIEVEVLGELIAKEETRAEILSLAAEKSMKYVESLAEGPERDDAEKKANILSDEAKKASDERDKLKKMKADVINMAASAKKAEATSSAA